MSIYEKRVTVHVMVKTTIHGLGENKVYEASSERGMDVTDSLDHLAENAMLVFNSNLRRVIQSTIDEAKRVAVAKEQESSPPWRLFGNDRPRPDEPVMLKRSYYHPSEAEARYRDAVRARFIEHEKSPATWETVNGDGFYVNWDDFWRPLTAEDALR